MPWDDNQWATWEGDREALEKHFKGLGLPAVTKWSNGKPCFACPVDYSVIEAAADAVTRGELVPTPPHAPKREKAHVDKRTTTRRVGNNSRRPRD